MSESTDRLKAIFEGTAEIKPEDVHFDPRRDRIGGGSFGDVYRGKPPFLLHVFLPHLERTANKHTTYHTQRN